MREVHFKNCRNILKMVELEDEPIFCEATAGKIDDTFGYDYIMASAYRGHSNLRTGERDGEGMELKEDIKPALIVVFNSEDRRQKFIESQT